MCDAYTFAKGVLAQVSLGPGKSHASANKNIDRVSGSLLALPYP
jgi:hypothetical protein